MNIWERRHESGWHAARVLARPWWLALTLSTIVAAAAIAAGVHSGSGSRTAALGNQDQAASAAAAPPTDAPSATDRRLWIKDDQELVPFENGHEVALPDVNVEIYVAPYPPGRKATLDFYLTRNDAPVEGATVSLKYDMTIMEHGPFELLAAPRGPGHYQVPIDFAMTGDFWINVAVDRDGSESLIHMILRAVR